MLSHGAIAGIVVGCIVGVAFFVVFYICFRRRRAALNTAPQAYGPAELQPVYPTVGYSSPYHSGHEVEAELSPDDSVSMVGAGAGGELVNLGSMQVKGVRDIRGDSDRGIY